MVDSSQLDQESTACLLGRIDQMSERQLTESRRGQQSWRQLLEVAQKSTPTADPDMISALELGQLKALVKFANSQNRHMQRDTTRQIVRRTGS